MGVTVFQSFFPGCFNDAWESLTANQTLVEKYESEDKIREGVPDQYRLFLIPQKAKYLVKVLMRMNDHAILLARVKCRDDFLWFERLWNRIVHTIFD